MYSFQLRSQNLKTGGYSYSPIVLDYKELKKPGGGNEIQEW